MSVNLSKEMTRLLEDLAQEGNEGLLASPDGALTRRMAEGAVYVLRHRPDLRVGTDRTLATLPTIDAVVNAGTVELPETMGEALRAYAAAFYFGRNSGTDEQRARKPEELGRFAALAGVPVPTV